MGIIYNFNQVAPLFILAVFGYYIKKWGIAGTEFTESIAEYNITILLPCVIIRAMCIDMTPERWVTGYKSLLLGFAALVLVMLLSYVVTKPLRGSKPTKAIMWCSLVFCNYSLVGFVTVQNLYGAEAMFYTNLALIPFIIGVYTIQIIAIQSSVSDGPVNGAAIGKMLLSPPIIACGIGLLLFITGLRPPTLVANTIDMLADSMTAMGMIQIGMALYGKISLDFITDARTYLLTFVKLFVVPLAVVLMLRAFGLSGYAAAGPALCLSAPVSVMLTIQSLKYGGDSEFSAKLLIFSSLASVLTIPLMAYILQQIAGVG